MVVLLHIFALAAGLTGVSSMTATDYPLNTNSDFVSCSTYFMYDLENDVAVCIDDDMTSCAIEARLFSRVILISNGCGTMRDEVPAQYTCANYKAHVRFGQSQSQVEFLDCILTPTHFALGSLVYNEFSGDLALMGEVAFRAAYGQVDVGARSDLLADKYSFPAYLVLTSSLDENMRSTYRVTPDANPLFSWLSFRLEDLAVASWHFDNYFVDREVDYRPVVDFVFSTVGNCAPRVVSGVNVFGCSGRGVSSSDWNTFVNLDTTAPTFPKVYSEHHKTYLNSMYTVGTYGTTATYDTYLTFCANAKLLHPCAIKVRRTKTPMNVPTNMPPLVEKSGVFPWTIPDGWYSSDTNNPIPTTQSALPYVGSPSNLYALFVSSASSSVLVDFAPNRNYWTPGVASAFRVDTYNFPSTQALGAPFLLWNSVKFQRIVTLNLGVFTVNFDTKSKVLTHSLILTSPVNYEFMWLYPFSPLFADALGLHDLVNYTQTPRPDKGLLAIQQAMVALNHTVVERDVSVNGSVGGGSGGGTVVPPTKDSEGISPVLLLGIGVVFLLGSAKKK